MPNYFVNNIRVNIQEASTNVAVF